MIAFLIIMLEQGEEDIRSAMMVPRGFNVSLRRGCSHAAAVKTLVAQGNVEGHGGKWAEGK